MLGRNEPVVNAIDLFRGLRPQRITCVTRITGMRRTVPSRCVCQELTHRQHSKGVSPTRYTNSRSWSDTARTVCHEPVDLEAVLVNGGGVGHEQHEGRQRVGCHAHAEVRGDCQTKPRDCLRERQVQTKSVAPVWSRVHTKNFR